MQLVYRNMDYRNCTVLLVAVILLFSSRRGICKDLCHMDFTKVLEEKQNVRHEANQNACDMYEIRDTTVKSEVHCIEACYKNGECNSLYYNKNSNYCILYSNGQILTNCLIIDGNSNAYHAFFKRLEFQRMVSKKLLY